MCFFFFLPINVPGLSTVSHPTEVMDTVYRWASWTLELLITETNSGIFHFKLQAGPSVTPFLLKNRLWFNPK